MSSSQISIPNSQSRLKRKTRVPAHIAFSSSENSDHLGVLWESGEVETYSLKTRVGPGKGKVMDPSTTSLFIPEDEADIQYRQLQLYSQKATYVLLGSRTDGIDAATFITVSSLETGDVLSKETLVLPGSNGRLMGNGIDAHVYWQNARGVIFESEYIDIHSRVTLVKNLCSFIVSGGRGVPFRRILFKFPSSGGRSRYFIRWLDRDRKTACCLWENHSKPRVWGHILHSRLWLPNLRNHRASSKIRTTGIPSCLVYSQLRDRRIAFNTIRLGSSKS